MQYLCKYCKKYIWIDDAAYLLLPKEPDSCTKCTSSKLTATEQWSSYTWDPVVDKVIKQLIDRSKLWQKKYNTTLENNNLSLKQWLQHTLEELMDACNYLQKTIDTLP